MQTVLTLLSLSAAVLGCLAVNYPVQDPAKCTPGTKFLDKKSSSFLRECKTLGRQTYSVIIGCLDFDKNFVDFGKTFDQLITDDGHGFRYSCNKLPDGRFEVKPTACVFAKGTKEEVATMGQATIKSLQQVCTCKDNAHRFGCTALQG